MIRRCGNSNPELTSAARTRSRDSRTAASGRPTIANEGRPDADVDLDPDLPRLDPEDRERAADREHRATVGARGARVARELSRIWPNRPRHRRAPRSLASGR